MTTEKIGCVQHDCAECQARLAAPSASPDAQDAARYRWIRNPKQSIDSVCTKVTGSTPGDEGTGITPTLVYEWKAGDELDRAIDAAITKGGA